MSSARKRYYFTGRSTCYKNGYREPKHDQFKEDWQTWNYAIRGITLQEEHIRVIVSFDEKKQLLIITVINLVRRGIGDI